MGEMKEVSDFKEKQIILIEEEPCQIMKIYSSMPGKHGHVKYSIETIGVFDGRRRNLSEPSDAKVEVPDVKRGKAQVLSITGESAQLMSVPDYETFEVKIPEELQGKLEEGEEVDYIQAEGRRKIERKSQK